MEQEVFMETMHAIVDKIAPSLERNKKDELLRETWKLFREHEKLDIEDARFILALLKTRGIQPAEYQAKAIKKLLTS